MKPKPGSTPDSSSLQDNVPDKVKLASLKARKAGEALS